MIKSELYNYKSNSKTRFLRVNYCSINFWQYLFLVVGTFWSHWTAIFGGFIWDDDAHVTRVDLRDLEGLKKIWFNLGATQQYYPLLHSIFWVEHKFFGDNASLYHLTNIGLHLIAVLCLVALLRRLLIPGAWLSGFIFALHPVYVESVAWITEEKNTISAIFYLIAANLYFKFNNTKNRNLYIYATGVFILALLSKTVTATLPAAILVLIWWRNGRISFKKDVIPLIPWFILGAVGGLFTAWVERVYIGANGADFALSYLQRILLASHVIIFYLGKILWPVNLIFIYQHWDLKINDLSNYVYIVVLLVGLFVLVRLALKGYSNESKGVLYRSPLAAFLFFIGTLFPVLGFANVYPFMFSYVADHFQYLASLGIVVYLSAVIIEFAKHFEKQFQNLGAAVAGVLLTLLGVLSATQCLMYKDAETLYLTTIERNPTCWMARNNVGAIWLNKGRIADAQKQFEEAIRLRHDYADAQSNLCNTLIHTGDFKGAVEHGIVAVNLRMSADNENNLAIAYAGINETKLAIIHYINALKLRPNFPQVANNVANLYLQIGQYSDAANYYTLAIKLAPNYAEPYSNMGILLYKLGKVSEALNYYTKAIVLDPNNAQFYNSLGEYYRNTGDNIKALKEFSNACKLNQNSITLLYNLATTQVATGNYKDSVSIFETILRIQSNNIGALNNMGAVMYKLNRIPESIGYYSRAIQLMPNYAEAHSNLGVSLASAKLIDDAILEYKKALDIKPDYVDAMTNYGLALFSKDNFKEALEIISKATKLSPNNSYLHGYLSEIYSKMNRINDAKRELELSKYMELHGKN